MSVKEFNSGRKLAQAFKRFNRKQKPQNGAPNDAIGYWWSGLLRKTHYTVGLQVFIIPRALWT